MTLVCGVDPGREGFECVHGEAEDAAKLGESLPTFAPAPTGNEGDYDLAKMAGMARAWFRAGVALVVLERQAPRPHAPGGRFGGGREGTVSSFNLGRGFGAWEASLVGAGFRGTELHSSKALVDVLQPRYLIVEPQVWKRRMGCLLQGFKGSDTARRKESDAQAVQVAQRLAPALDFRPVERETRGKPRVPSPDKCCAFLLACYARWLIGEAL